MAGKRRPTRPTGKQTVLVSLSAIAIALLVWSFGLMAGRAGTASAAAPAPPLSAPPAQSASEPAGQQEQVRPKGILELVDSYLGKQGSANASSQPKDAPNGGCGLDWRVVPSPNVGTDTNLLGDVDVLSPTYAWSVGYYMNTGGPFQPLTVHWNGTSWNTVPANGPGLDNELVGVTIVSPNDVWATGAYRPNTGDPFRTLAMHWNGSAWSVVPTPNLGAKDNILYAVDAVSPSEVWAAGFYTDASNVTHTMIQRWNGSVWDIVPSPDFGSNTNILVGMDVVSANNIWVAGAYASSPGASRALIQRWNGTSWTSIPTPSVMTSTLYAIDGLSANSAWATGATTDADGRSHTLTMHWNGTAWSVVPSPDPGTDDNLLAFYGLAAVSENEVWATGYYNNTGGIPQTLALRWNGSLWSQVPTDNPGTYSNNLLGVAAVSSMNLWAVGESSNDGTTSQTLVERYNDPCVTPSPTPTACPIQYTDVPPDNTFYPFVRCLACRGILSGYDTGCDTGNPCFKPNANVTRGQLSKIVSNAAGFNEPVTTQSFEDVTPGSTFFEFIGRLTSRGVIAGYACGSPGEPCVPPGDRPYFRPGNNATRGQLSKIVCRAYNCTGTPTGQTFEDVPPGYTFYTDIEQLVALGAINGYPCGSPGEPCVLPDNRPYFRPGNNVTRGQTSKIVSSAFFPVCAAP